MGRRLRAFLSEDSGSVSAEFAFLFPIFGAALVLAACQVSSALHNPQNRVAAKARVRRRRRG